MHYAFVSSTLCSTSLILGPCHQSPWGIETSFNYLLLALQLSQKASTIYIRVTNLTNRNNLSAICYLLAITSKSCNNIYTSNKSHENSRCLKIQFNYATICHQLPTREILNTSCPKCVPLYPRQMMNQHQSKHIASWIINIDFRELQHYCLGQLHPK